VKQIGAARNWKAIAELVRTRSAGQCSQRWHKRLRPELAHIRNGTWSEAEDEKLRGLVNAHASTHGGVDILGMWKGISRAMGWQRTPKQCRERWRHFLDPKLKVGAWTKEENEKMMALYDKLGRKWSEISKQLPGRTAGRVKRQAEALLRDRVHAKLKRDVTASWKDGDGSDEKLGSCLNI